VGFGGRARIILVNTDLLTPEEYPDSIEDLLSPRYPANKVGLAYPLFGTTATHAASLYAFLGADEARAYFQELATRGVGVVDGNSVVKDRVSNGEWLFGLTDTDDACQAIQRGEPVTLVFPDQQPDGLGALVIPNTVALVAGGTNPVQGEKLVDYLLSPAVESDLVNAGWIQFPLRPVDMPPVCGARAETRSMQVDFAQIYQQMSLAQQELGELFVR
jgi:iron(III) transport system substrate-binding protein